MPAVMTLEGPSLNRPTTLGPRGRGSIQPATATFYGATPEPLPWASIVLVGIGAAAATWLARRVLGPNASLRGASMLDTIARESRSPAEFARRAEAWNAGERRPLSAARLAKAYRKKGRGSVAKLIREAHEARVEGRERLWSKMSRGLR